MLEEATSSRLSAAFARFMAKRARGLSRPQLVQFEALMRALCAGQQQGHSCLMLNAETETLVKSSGLATAADSPAEVMPLVIDHNRLYLQRYWYYEQRLAGQLKQLALASHQYQGLEALLARYFPELPPDGDRDWQREAAKMAVTNSFAMITGGPGTGKTTTVVKILAMLQELSPTPLLMALAAPTGKAAMRLRQALNVSKAGLPCAESIKAVLPDHVTTLHRLLGARLWSPFFRHNAGQPLIYDLVVVDEASMVDLALMSKLVDALKPGARLLLLGDRQQLASVESGAVLADLTAAMPSHTVELKKSHRFGGAIKALAEAVNLQQSATAWQLLQQQDSSVMRLENDTAGFIAAHKTGYLQLINAGAGPAEVFAEFNRFQALCANRQGRFGVVELNRAVEHKLKEQGWLETHGQIWYPGRPVMVVQNSPVLQLYNGDIGLCFADEKGSLSVVFEREDGSFKHYLPARLPRCETVFAMTIHKSQGSEFERILLVLPESINPVLSKELIYTAITRAKKAVVVYSSQPVFVAAINQSIERSTGLAERLRHQ
ncbi:MAG: exodeoxyribonuclease V subunit alpha [Methylobacter sp.]|nr:MAG: exodeoxyribonuclease V subunit alpha [Methylobacter sp.]PPD35252.1 MAG: exodeoxyribonuclease V subunit alpha [Methylomonas sp.]